MNSKNKSYGETKRVQTPFCKPEGNFYSHLYLCKYELSFELLVIFN